MKNHTNNARIIYDGAPIKSNIVFSKQTPPFKDGKISNHQRFIIC